YVINDSSQRLIVYNSNVPATRDLTVNHGGSASFFQDSISLTSGISTITDNFSAVYIYVYGSFQLSSGDATITENLSATQNVNNYGTYYALSSGTYDISVTET